MNAPQSGVRVELFGAFSLHDEQGRSIKLPARSAALLLAFLALHPSGVARAEVAAALWPDSDPELARSALRTAIHRARLALGDEAITDDGRLRLTLATDVAEAARLQRARRNAANVDDALATAWMEWNIVQRDLLADWDDEWIEPLREDAHHQAYECGGALARLLEERSEREKALEVLDGILSRLPHHAESLEHAMRLENALKGREAALVRVAEARRSLSQTVGMPLPDSIQKLERMIRRGTTGYLPPPAAFSNGQTFPSSAICSRRTCAAAAPPRSRPSPRRPSLPPAFAIPTERWTFFAARSGSPRASARNGRRRSPPQFSTRSSSATMPPFTSSATSSLPRFLRSTRTTTAH